MLDQLPLRPIEEARGPSVTDLVFDALYRQVVELRIEPGTKISEAEVSKLMGVSRQPVRDAFYRLSQLGFLLVRPQRATVVTHISPQAVREAAFMRTAIELETVRAAALAMDSKQCAKLEALVAEQIEAIKDGNRVLFHELDDRFHKQICEVAGHGYAWKLIRDFKAHMDRVRYLSLAFSADRALNDHIALMEAMKRKDETAIQEIIREHLSRIATVIERLKDEHRDYFVDDDE
ncbi:GntR family transcriptional regulator [Nitratireductor basaltis]|uniref:GntR family transcriptional regulator n=1 Tax=Nitratireductor basaltis TaxID=472175 RepID=A0A084U5A6_9HYPH|nr:GntR family transcriptional regulator [Nitratireductor basaltis]KFB08142.1 GntR family transcriptional regulator [Nitratireductor basaltis]